jgi:tRNA(Ile)-lysidine synthase
VSEPSLSTLARRVLDAHVPQGATILVACSGGVDSQVLLDVLVHVGRRDRIRVVACGIDHGLRSEAKQELGLVDELARARGVPFRTVEVAVRRGGNLQARARDARWEALRSVAAEVGARKIATAHHRDDRAETVLIRILRGAPLEGLAVLGPATHDVIRPLIAASRSRIESHAIRRRLAWAVDPSNADARHLRSRVRAEVMPLLRTLDPRIEEHLVTLAEGAAKLTLSEVDEKLDKLAKTTRSSARAMAALRDAAARGIPASVLLPGGDTAAWDGDGRIVIRRGARWHGR